MTKEVKVLDKGYVRLEGFSGSDLMVVNAARASFNKNHDEMEPGDDKLIDYLMRKKHATPFEMIDLTFRVKAPKPVICEWMRHRFSSFNEASSRYVVFEPEFFIPCPDAIRTQIGKAGNYTFQSITNMDTVESIQYIMKECYDFSYQKYQDLMALGLAKEVARNVLPFGFYSTFYYKANLRSLFNFLSLRNDERALLEIQEYAKVIEQFVAEVAPISYESFVRNGRVAI